MNCFVRFKQFLSYFGEGYNIKLAHMLFMAFMSSLLEFLSIVLVFPFLMIMVNPSRVVNNPLAVFIQNHFHVYGTDKMILFVGCLIAAAIIIKNLYCILIQYWQNKMISKWGLEIKEKFLEYFLYAPYEVDLQRGDSKFIFRLTSNIDEIMKFFVSKVISLISNTFVILIFTAVLYNFGYNFLLRCRILAIRNIPQRRRKIIRKKE